MNVSIVIFMLCSAVCVATTQIGYAIMIILSRNRSSSDICASASFLYSFLQSMQQIRSSNERVLVLHSNYVHLLL